MGFRVYGLGVPGFGFRISGSCFRLSYLRFTAYGLWIGLSSLGFMVCGGFRVWGSGMRLDWRVGHVVKPEIRHAVIHATEDALPAPGLQTPRALSRLSRACACVRACMRACAAPVQIAELFPTCALTLVASATPRFRVSRLAACATVAYHGSTRLVLSRPSSGYQWYEIASTTEAPPASRNSWIDGGRCPTTPGRICSATSGPTTELLQLNAPSIPRSARKSLTSCCECSTNSKFAKYRFGSFPSSQAATVPGKWLQV